MLNKSASFQWGLFEETQVIEKNNKARLKLEEQVKILRLNLPSKKNFEADFYSISNYCRPLKKTLCRPYVNTSTCKFSGQQDKTDLPLVQIQGSILGSSCRIFT